MRQCSWKLLFMISLAVLTGCETPPDQTGENLPNIVILFADDLGYGDLQSYGHPLFRTPNTDSLARQGIRLTSFYMAAPSCSPSRAALITGRYPHRVNLTSVLGPAAEGGLSLSEITLAEILKEEGYRTGAVGKWHLGHHPAEYLPTSRGFDEYFGLPYSNDMMPPWVQTDIPLRFYENGSRLDTMEVDQTRLTTEYTSRAVDFIESHSGSPFFLYLAYSMPHVPIYAPEERAGSSKAGKYGDVIETIDWSVGEIMNVLEKEGISDNTILVFSSDNGPWKYMPERMFSENVIGMHESVKPWDHGSTGLLNGAKATIYEGGYRVPGIIRWPEEIPSNQVSSEMMTAMDLFVTLAETAGAELPEDRIYDGFNMMNLLRGGDSPQRETFFYGTGAVRKNDWKLIMTDPDQPELYNLRLDPAEEHNRTEDEAETVRELTLLLSEFSIDVQNF